MSLEFHTHPDFVHILRILNTNVDGKRKVEVAIQDIRGVGYRYARLACKKADIHPSKRAGELTPDEVSKIVAILQQPQQFKIPQWFVNRQKDFKDGKYKHLTANALDAAIREDLERLKKIRAHRGLRHCWNLKCRGQHTKTTGRHGRTVGVSTKKK